MHDLDLENSCENSTKAIPMETINLIKRILHDLKFSSSSLRSNFFKIVFEKETLNKNICKQFQKILSIEFRFLRGEILL